MVLADARRRPGARRRRPRHAGRARPRLAGPPRDDRPARWPTPSRERSRISCRASSAATSSRAALGEHGWIVLAPDLDAAIAFVDGYAPEHLSIDVADAEAAAARIRNAGSIFIGPWAPESAGDYATGANHVLPTGGLARSSGPLSVEAYGRFSQIQRLDRDGLAAIADTIRTLATTEGLTAHRNAVDARFRDDAEEPAR